MTTTTDLTVEENFWNVFGSAAKKKHGKLADLNAVDKSHGEAVKMLQTAGMIKTGHGFTGDTYKITKDGLSWIKLLFGTGKNIF